MLYISYMQYHIFILFIIHLYYRYYSNYIYYIVYLVLIFVISFLLNNSFYICYIFNHFITFLNSCKQSFGYKYICYIYLFCVINSCNILFYIGSAANDSSDPVCVSGLTMSIILIDIYVIYYSVFEKYKFQKLNTPPEIASI